MEAWQLKEERQILKPHEVQAGGENEDDSPEGQAGDLHETSGGRHSCLDLVWSWSLDNIAVTAVVLPSFSAHYHSSLLLLWSPFLLAKRR